MTLKQAIDHAIDQGSKHISLSPKQFRWLSRSTPLLNLDGTYSYRSVLITIWSDYE